MFDRTEFKVSNLVQKVVIPLVMRKRVFLTLARGEVRILDEYYGVNHRGNHSGAQNLPETSRAKKFPPAWVLPTL